MDAPKVLFYYAVWHYGRAIKEGYNIWKNFMWFLYHFFSIRILTKTFFSKFERLGEGYKKGIYIQHNLTTFLVNTIMRCVGMGIRSVVIVIGLVAMCIMTVFGLFALVLWLLFPFGIFLSVVIGFVKIFSL